MLTVGLSPLEALEKYYNGEKLGVWEGDFIRNEKRRGLKLPGMLQDFLRNYGYFDVNRGMSQMWLPDKIDPDRAKVDGELNDVWIIGTFRKHLVALLVSECEQADPIVLLDDLPEENGEDVTLVFNKSELKLSELLIDLLIDSPAVYHNSLVCDQPEELKAVVDECGSQDLKELLDAGKRPSRTLCWDDEKREFLAVILAPKNEILVKFRPGLSPRELEGIFSKEFYENENCDYAHALKIVSFLIEFWEKQNNQLILGEKYALAGRCCWALKKWKEADEWYKKAEKLFAQEMRDVVERCRNFYEGLGNFYLAKEDVFKSQHAYDEADRIGQFTGDGGARSRGNRLMKQAGVMTEIEKFEKAIEYYDRALKVFQKEPKDCKYEIARCQQLRGEVRKKIKTEA